jgi:hypothetical protein
MVSQCIRDALALNDDEYTVYSIKVLRKKSSGWFAVGKRLTDFGSNQAASYPSGAVARRGGYAIFVI